MEDETKIPLGEQAMYFAVLFVVFFLFGCYVGFGWLIPICGFLWLFHYLANH